MMKAYGSDHDFVDENGQTPVYYAIKSNRADVLKYLLDLGCNLSIIDTKGHSALNYALRNNKHHFKELLLKYGAPPPPDVKTSKKIETKKV